MKYLDAEEILLIHHQLIERYGGAHGTRDLERVKSVAAAPSQHVFDREQYESVYHKAATYARDIIQDHPFFDGNKRTGITVAIMFLARSGYTFRATVGEVENFALRIAVDRLDIKDISNWLEQHARPS